MKQIMSILLIVTLLLPLYPAEKVSAAPAVSDEVIEAMITSISKRKGLQIDTNYLEAQDDFTKKFMEAMKQLDTAPPPRPEIQTDTYTKMKEAITNAQPVPNRAGWYKTAIDLALFRSNVGLLFNVIELMGTQVEAFMDHLEEISHSVIRQYDPEIDNYVPENANLYLYWLWWHQTYQWSNSAGNQGTYVCFSYKYIFSQPSGGSSYFCIVGNHDPNITDETDYNVMTQSFKMSQPFHYAGTRRVKVTVVLNDTNQQYSEESEFWNDVQVKDITGQDEKVLLSNEYIFQPDLYPDPVSQTVEIIFPNPAEVPNFRQEIMKAPVLALTSESSIPEPTPTSNPSPTPSPSPTPYKFPDPFGPPAPYPVPVPVPVPVPDPWLDPDPVVKPPLPLPSNVDPEICGCKRAYSLGKPWEFGRPFIRLVSAVVGFIVGLAGFIVTIFTVEPIPIQNEGFQFVRELKIGDIPVYDAILSLVTLFLALAIYRVIKKAFS